MLKRLYRRSSGPKHSFEECFYIELQWTLESSELELLQWLISTPLHSVSEEPSRKDADVVEIGPRLSVETPFSSSAVAICQSMGLPVRRIEMSTRYYCAGKNRGRIIKANLDQMTQEVYKSSLTTFESGLKSEPVHFVDVLGRGKEALHEANIELGLGMDAWDETHWAELFVHLRRNSTDVELFQIGNGNSEHSRHWFFRGDQVINGSVMPETLMDLVKAPLKTAPSNSLVAFHDNAGVIRGCEVDVLMPSPPGEISAYGARRLLQHLTATAETHNHPTLKSPFQGATTGSGGMERDKMAQGRGASQPGFSVAGYAVGNLHSKLGIPGETVGGEHIRADASPLQILIRGSNGVSDYGNKLGVPLIGGFTRTFGQIVNGFRREFRKPVLYCGGSARVFDMHYQKHSPEKGMLLVRIGGPAYRIGVGGGSASSMISGANDAELDLKSVQRGNAEMENRANRVIRACAEMCERNPIESIHDQGAGGPSNVLTELMEPTGGRVDIRKITLGDQTMSVLEIWVAEYQEG